MSGFSNEKNKIWESIEYLLSILVLTAGMITDHVAAMMCMVSFSRGKSMDVFVRYDEATAVWSRD